MKDNSYDFADLLGRYLVRAGFSQQELAHKIGMHRNNIVKWMNRTAVPTHRWQVLRLADELSLVKEERKALLQAAGFPLERWPTEVWTVPMPRDMFFTGRDTVFHSFRELLIPGSTTALTQAISGLGGIGKTHTAVEYAYRFHQDYEAVLWLQADSWETLISACIQLADELGLPKQKESDQAIAEVRCWLRKHRFWLLILDNVEHPQEILPKLLPTQHQGSVLLTTRVHDVEPLAQTQILSTMSEQEGILFLLRRTKKVASKAGLDQASAAQRDKARQIWQLMEGLPLALDQAGAYILETSCSFLAYRERYTRKRAELLNRRGKRFIGHEASVATTFSLAFERIEGLNPVAADILRVCSLLNSGAIPEELFQEGMENLGTCFSAERDDWDPAIGVLQDFSLVQRQTETNTLSIHRLVQAVLIDSMDEQTQRQWAEYVVRNIERIFSSIDVKAWSEDQRYISHALVCAEHIEQWDMLFPEAAHLLLKAGIFLQRQGAQYSEAEGLYKIALSIYEKVLGPKSFYTAGVLYNLANLYLVQDKNEESEQLLKRAQSITEEILGPEHSMSLSILNSLAQVYDDQGDYEEAEELLKHVLSIEEVLLGPKDPTIAIVLSNLAKLCRKQDRVEEAEQLYKRALAIQESVLDPDSPSMAITLEQMAQLYHLQSKNEEAEQFYRRALSIQEKVLGPEHYDTAITMHDLAMLLAEQGEAFEAKQLYQRALPIYEKVLR